ncbi:hypothetical protein [Nonomuraea salmonea]|uniref:hypothetical protein n=1 Tax=Nonomuraea salmonea TaxID=46181 RepID=UPI0031E615C1
MTAEPETPIGSLLRALPLPVKGQPCHVGSDKLDPEPPWPRARSCAAALRRTAAAHLHEPGAGPPPRPRAVRDLDPVAGR